MAVTKARERAKAHRASMTAADQLDLAIENVERLLDKRLFDAARQGAAWIEEHYGKAEGERMRSITRRLKLRTK